MSSFTRLTIDVRVTEHDLSPPAKTSFLDLPPELRTMIYDLSLITNKVIWPYATFYERTDGHALYKHWEIQDKLTTDLLRVNKLIHNECTPVLFCKNRWHMCSRGVNFPEQIWNCYAALLQRLEISFDYRGHTEDNSVLSISSERHGGTRGQYFVNSRPQTPSNLRLEVKFGRGGFECDVFEALRRFASARLQCPFEGALSGAGARSRWTNVSETSTSDDEIMEDVPIEDSSSEDIDMEDAIMEDASMEDVIMEDATMENWDWAQVGVHC